MPLLLGCLGALGKALRDKRGLPRKGAKTQSHPSAPGPCKTPAHQRVLHRCTEGDFVSRYCIGAAVMKVAHKGTAVLFATRLSDGLEVVVKARSKRDAFRTADDESRWRSTMQAQLNLPRIDTICELMEVVETRQHYYVVMERIHGSDLFETAIHERLSHRDAREAVRQTLEALAFLHHARRIHRDVKLENVVVNRGPSVPKAATPSGAAAAGATRQLCAKLIDFDTAEEWEPGRVRPEVYGSSRYMAPEVYRGASCPASDIYGVGVMMYALLANFFPIPDELVGYGPGENYVGSPAMERIYGHLQAHEIDFACSPFDTGEEAADLCRALLAFDPGRRLTADEALAHGWFQLPL